MFLRSIVLALMLMPSPAPSQQAVPPPPKPADSGPTLVDTMKFIHDKLSDHGKVNYLSQEHGQNQLVVTTTPDGEEHRDLHELTTHFSFEVEQIIANPTLCTLGSLNLRKESSDSVADGGKMTEERIELSFKNIETIAVESLEERNNRLDAESGTPQFTHTVVPVVYSLILSTSTPTFSVHSAEDFYGNMASNRARKPTATLEKHVEFIFREEDIANRVAKAMTRAVELCGGGNKDPF